MQESNYLKDDFNNVRQLLAIPCLKDFTINDLSSLLRLSRMRHYTDGETIIAEGDLDPWIYFLLSGKVKIRKGGVVVGRVDRMGELFGEMRVLDGLARSASVVAEGKTICLGVDTSASHRLQSPEEIGNLVALFYKIFSKALSCRLRMANEQMVRLKKELIRLKAANGPTIPVPATPQVADPARAGCC